MSKRDNSNTYAENILKELVDNGELTLEMLYNELGVTFQDIKEPIATLLRNGKIRISGFENFKIKKDKNGEDIKVPRKVLALKYLKFERQYPHSTFHIHQQFRRMESDISGFEETSNYLLKRFEDKFKEYQKWENDTLKIMKKYVICISYEEVYNEIDRIIKNNLDVDTDSSIDENVKAYLLQHILTGPKNQDKTRLIELKEKKEWMEKHNYTHYCFLKSIKFQDLPKILPPGFPKFLNSYGSIPNHVKMDPEEYLHICEVRTLPKGFIWIEDTFMELLFYINTPEGSMMKNTLIKCLSDPKNEDENIRSLKTLGEFLKKLKVIEPNFMENLGRDENGNKLKE